MEYGKLAIHMIEYGKMPLTLKGQITFTRVKPL